MSKSLEVKILERQIKLVERQMRDVLDMIHPPNELGESVYLEHSPVNSGPEYLTVQVTLWPYAHLETEDGTTVSDLTDARKLAEKRGYKGIRVTFH